MSSVSYWAHFIYNESDCCFCLHPPMHDHKCRHRATDGDRTVFRGSIFVMFSRTKHFRSYSRIKKLNSYVSKVSFGEEEEHG